MARPLKPGLDYFPLDVRSDDKIELIEAEFGMIGFAVVVKFWQKIYAEHGYYCEFNDEVALLFASKNKVGRNAVSEILRASFKRGIFDSALFEKYGILTSRGIQRRYLECCKKRKSVEIKKEYLLLNLSEVCGNVILKDDLDDLDVNGTLTDINGTLTGVNGCINSQSKVKEKVNIKVKGKVNSVPPETPKHTYGIYDNVFLRDSEVKKLESEFPYDWEERIDHLSEYMSYSGKSYDNHYATIRYWAKMDDKKGRNVKKSKFNNYEDSNKTDFADLENKLFDMMMEGAEQ